MQKPHPVRVIDTEFNFLDYIVDYTSFQFERKLFEIGNFELQLYPKPQNISSLKKGNLIFTDRKHCGIITSIEMTHDKSGVKMIIKGTQLKGILSKRITVPDERADGGYFGYLRYPDAEEPDAPAETIIKSYINSQVINPADENRKFPNMIMIPDLMRGNPMRWSSRFESLDKVLKSIGEYSGTGYDITLNTEQERFVFDVIEKKIKTAGSDNPIIFSADFGNISDVKYSSDNKNFVNSAYAGGAGEDEERFIMTVFPDENIPSGFDRFESWVDCGSIDIPDDLIYEAQHKLTDKIKAESVDASILDSGPFIYGRDWDIGDVVTVQSKRLGVELDTQITAVKEVFEQKKSSLKVTFGTKSKIFLDEIRKTEVVR